MREGQKLHKFPSGQNGRLPRALVIVVVGHFDVAPSQPSYNCKYFVSGEREQLIVARNGATRARRAKIA